MSLDKNNLLDRIRAYKVGAQEFLSKPFDLKETELIIRSKIEYYHQNKSEIDPTSKVTSGKLQKIILGDENVEVTAMEYNLLKYFIDNSEKLIELTDIAKQICQDTSKSDLENASSLIYRLRSKIETDPKIQYI